VVPPRLHPDIGIAPIVVGGVTGNVNYVVRSASALQLSRAEFAPRSSARRYRTAVRDAA
jgi:hypothetical protein